MFPPSRSCSSCSELRAKHLLCSTSARIAAFTTKTFSLLSLFKIQAKITDQEKSIGWQQSQSHYLLLFQYMFSHSLPACKPLKDTAPFFTCLQSYPDTWHNKHHPHFQCPERRLLINLLQLVVVPLKPRREELPKQRHILSN